ncbi:electron transfer flavoprotein subunit alpha/FixB family protein [Vulcanisaeta souniana]|uniref:electron transfer flavoprotein subunit alpha/FixB family protein n=1 Tax=Vulcanisaeta souniana TaxID=164452 RepID=UPI001FB39FC9|nr:electron transfer flavoprotein subunit alpha/FixB family protein [Vulcanisaeta souniana]
MTKVLVIGSINDTGLIGLAQKVGNPEIHYLVLGTGDTSQLGKYGVTKAYLLTAQVDETSFAETLIGVINSNNYSVVIAPPASKFFKTAIPISAQKLLAPVIVDVLDLKQSDSAFEVTYNGVGNRAQVTVKVSDKVFLIAPPARFKPSEKATTVSTESLQPKVVTGVKVVSTEEKPKGKVRIEDAELIVSVGRGGFKKQEDLKLAFELAEVLGGAEVGCSRPIAADLKWLSEDHWVGLSGHKVRPKLYMAIGISGQPQHLAGMMEAKTVVVINSDPNAPFFKNCDYGVVEDLYKFVPALTKKLREILKK